MIPLTVELTDFLSHRCTDGQPVVFDFEGAVLWSVSGDNGAGKSAIFDAITWTLFACHRGGTQAADKLICHGADRCHAGFSFELEGTRYKVERSARRRGAARRGAFKWDPAANSWEAVPDTTTERGFNTWREQLLGLSYEAFIHSVLLLQNGSDTLIKTGAKNRFEVLAQLIDLSALKRLEDRAKAGHAKARAKRSSLEGDIQSLQPVTDDEREAANAEKKRLEAERDINQQAVQTQSEVVAGAKQFENLGKRLADTRAEIEAAEELVADSERIKAQATEAEALARFRTPLELATGALASAAEAANQAAQASTELQKIDLAELEQVAATAAAQAERAKQAATIAAQEASKKAKPLPAIETVVARRLELDEAKKHSASLGAPAELAQQIEGCHGDSDELQRKVDTAAGAEQEGRQQLVQAEAALIGLREALSDMEAGKNEPICSRCGQEVPEEHRQLHLAEARQAVSDQEAWLEELEAGLRPLSAALEQATSILVAKTEALNQLTLTHTQAENAQLAVERAQARFDTALAAAALKDFDDPRAVDLEGADAEGLTELPETLRQEAAQTEAEAERLAGAAAEAESAAAAAAAGRQAAIQERQALEGSVETLTSQAANHRQHAHTQLEFVEDSWVARVLAGEVGLVEELEARLAQLQPAVAERHKLEQAERALNDLRTRKSEVEALLGEIQLAHQVPVAAAELELDKRREQLSTVAGLLDDARDQLRELERRDQELEHKRQDLGQALQQERIYRRMVTLLSRQGLQGQLLERAARILEVLGNETLTAISGGNLRLEIRRSDQRGRDELTICALDLTAGGERTDAAFLSGSEKFRVCVAMAAAIGKYASGRSSLDSLIIDEGFGSLDETSRDQMIEELQQLAQFLERVIVVSHQGEFHDRTRFPHGYLLRRTGNATEVTRYL